jgi:hypothetical protein
MLTFNQIDATNLPCVSIGIEPYQLRSICRKGDALYGISFGGPEGPIYGTTILHKSVDAGATWTVLSLTCPLTRNNDHPWLTLVPNPVTGKLHFILVNSEGGSPSFHESIYDEGADSWTPEDIWPEPLTASGVSDGAFFVGIRNTDGALFLAFQSGSTHLGKTVKVNKRTSTGTWSTIVEVGDPTNGDDLYEFQSAIFDKNWNLHSMYMWTDLLGDGHVELRHLSVSTADVPSVDHYVDTPENGNYYSAAFMGVMDVRADGTELAYGYATNITYGYPDPQPTGTVKVARADLSTTPLNPSWVTEDVDATNSANNYGAYATIGVSYAGASGNPKVYFLSDAISGGGNPPQKIFLATKATSWSTSDEYTSDTANNVYLYHMTLLNSFTNGTGVLIETSQNLGGGAPPIKLWYTGPPISGRFTFAYTGGKTRSRSARLS